jgi:cell division protein FtsB
MQNPTTSPGNTQSYHSSYLDLTNVLIVSLHDPGYVAPTLTQELSTVVINLSAHVQTLSARIQNISAENEALKRKVAELEVLQAGKSAQG